MFILFYRILYYYYLCGIEIASNILIIIVSKCYFSTIFQFF